MLLCADNVFERQNAGSGRTDTGYGRAAYEIQEGEDRERFYYYTALYTDEEGEVELREYQIKGDARKEENYQFTGNKWDVLYSFNIVARK